MLLGEGGVVHAHRLPPTRQTVPAGEPGWGGALPEVLDAVERDMIQDALKATRGNMARAARELGITERIMGLRVKKLSIDPRRVRTSR